MELNVPYVKQPPGSVWCGAATATMALKFYGKKVSLKRVAGELHIKSSKGINNAHLASYFLNHEMDVTVQAWSSGMTEKLRSRESLSGDTAIKILRSAQKNVRSKARILCRELVALTKRGGSIIFHPITLEDLRSRLENGSVVIMCVDSKHFIDISRKTGHYVLICGITDHDSQVSQPYVYVHDPILGSSRFITVQRILGACNSWFGSAIYVTPKVKGEVQ